MESTTMPESLLRAWAPSSHDTQTTRFYLERFIPTELADLILDAAEYWPSIVVDKVGDTRVHAAFVDPHEAARCILITPPLPSTAKYAWRVRFVLDSHDQGWGGVLEHRGKYVASYTCFQASIIRGVPEGMLQCVFELKPGMWREETEVKNTEQDAMEGRWLVQKNAQAVKTRKVHEVVWDHGGTEDVDGTLTRSKGCGTGKGFLEAFKPGDRLAVIARAQYVGWVNHVHRVKVEIFYKA